jgi:hypothetical protein
LNQWRSRVSNSLFYILIFFLVYEKFRTDQLLVARDLRQQRFVFERRQHGAAEAERRQDGAVGGASAGNHRPAEESRQTEKELVRSEDDGDRQHGHDGVLLHERGGILEDRLGRIGDPQPRKPPQVRMRLFRFLDCRLCRVSVLKKISIFIL